MSSKIQIVNLVVLGLQLAYAVFMYKFLSHTAGCVMTSTDATFRKVAYVVTIIGIVLLTIVLIGGVWDMVNPQPETYRR